MGGSSVYIYIYIKEIKEMIIGQKYSNLKFCKIIKKRIINIRSLIQVHECSVEGSGHLNYNVGSFSWIREIQKLKWFFFLNLKINYESQLEVFRSNNLCIFKILKYIEDLKYNFIILGRGGESFRLYRQEKG